MRKPLLNIIVLFSIIALVFGVASCTKTAEEVPAQVPDEVYEIRISSQMPIGHFLTDTTDLFCQRAEEMSNGRLKFTHYPSGQLLTDKEVADNIKHGTVEMAVAAISSWVELLPGMVLYYGVPELRDVPHYEQYNQQHLLPIFSDILETKANAKAVGHFLCLVDIGYICTQPLHEPADFQGLKIRTASPIIDPEIEALGGTCVLMSSADLYMALQQGTIDGAYTMLTSMVMRHLYEVAQNVIIIYASPAEFYAVSNLDFWNSLPEDLQQVILDAGDEAYEYSVIACLEAEEEARQYLREHGVEVYYPAGEEKAAFMQLIWPERQRWAADMFGQESVDEVIEWAEAAK